ncbi:alpha/beta hydrolase family protein [Nocardia tenerifensis]|uniref:Alpha/beta hydrolase family protein n=1 Tax=Nocardia tenerifensis TaxID=228006 RepID=A0A318KAL6_9NOCA|nr:alpha/beta hydrolase [Nocardia tenerifensis]PXX68536.1 alpha/beta hydrolase family protein [Nocardia tenerifensis]
MTTISHVRACQPDTMLAFGEHLAERNTVFTERLAQMNRDVDIATLNWQGAGAAAAAARALSHKLAGSHIGSAVVTIGERYNTFGAQLAAIRKSLLTVAETEVPAAGMTVDDQGNVTAPTMPGTSFESHFIQQLLNDQAASFQSRIKAHLVEFGDAETKAAQAIAADLEQLAGYRRAPDGAPLSPAVLDIIANRAQLPTDPKQLHDFWARLTPAEKDALFQHDHFIGNRDGIPQVDRDYYNRQNLNYLRADAQHKLDALLSFPPPGGTEEAARWQTQVDALQEQLAGYDKVRTEIRMKDGVPRFLSLIDDQGHAAIALHNPDTAGNVVTFVPGMNSKLSGIDAGVNSADAMRKAAQLADPSKQTAAIAWYGYETPKTLSDAAGSHMAKAAAAPLDSFQAGLRVTHEGPRATDVVVGHSYGTTAIGNAASGGHTLDADKVVFIASPGVDVERASELSLVGVDPDDVHDHLYATTAPSDPIRLAAASEAHGTSTESERFAHQFSSDGPSEGFLGYDTDAHNHYWDPDNRAMDNVGKIVTDSGPIS